VADHNAGPSRAWRCAPLAYEQVRLDARGDTSICVPASMGASRPRYAQPGMHDGSMRVAHTSRLVLVPIGRHRLGGVWILGETENRARHREFCGKGRRCSSIARCRF
jgi:hypothetical protein